MVRKSKSYPGQKIRARPPPVLLDGWNYRSRAPPARFELGVDALANRRGGGESMGRPKGQLSVAPLRAVRRKSKSAAKVITSRRGDSTRPRGRGKAAFGAEPARRKVRK